MSAPRPRLAVRLAVALVRVFSVLVPGRARRDWRQEWEAEIQHRGDRLEARDRDNWRDQMDLGARTLGALPDAAWLRRQFTADADLVHDLRHGVRMLRKSPAIMSLRTSPTVSNGMTADFLSYSVVIARSKVSSLSLSVVRSVSPMNIAPDVSVSRPARQCRSVDLPDPEGPMMAVSRPASKLMEIPSRARTSVGPLPYTLTASTARAATVVVVGAELRTAVIATSRLVESSSIERPTPAAESPGPNVRLCVSSDELCHSSGRS